MTQDTKPVSEQLREVQDALEIASIPMDNHFPDANICNTLSLLPNIIRRVEEMERQGWRPITEAPKTEDVWLRIEGYRAPILGKWFGNAWYGSRLDSASLRLDPESYKITHWKLYEPVPSLDQLPPPESEVLCPKP